MSRSGYEFQFSPVEAPRPKSVFSDPARQRRRRTRRYVLAAVLLAAAWSVVFFAGVFSQQPLHENLYLNLPGVPQVAGTGRDPLSFGTTPYAPDPARAMSAGGPMTELIEGGAIAHPAAPCTPQSTPAFAANAAEAAAMGPRLFAFLPSDKDWSSLSLDRECGAIDVLMPDWFAFTGTDLAVGLQPVDAEARQRVGAFIEQRGSALGLMPTVRMRPGIDRNEFFLNLADGDKRAALIERLQAAARSARADGLCLDFGRLTGTQAPLVGAFLKTLKPALAADNRQLCVVLRAVDDSWSSPQLADAADLYVVKLFNEPWAGSPVAPVAPQDWFRETAGKLVAHFGAAHLVVALGTSSYDWVSDTAVPEEIGFGEAMARVADAGAQVDFSPSAANAYASFAGPRGKRHQLWMLDAASAYNQLRILGRAGVTNAAIWGLGSEDPDIWTIVGTEDGLPLSLHPGFSEVAVEDYLTYTGEGPFVRLLAPAVAGHREVQQDPDDGLITGLAYSRLPRPAVMERFSAGNPRQVVLSFDDGPDPVYTEKILDELKQAGATAAFFAIGSQVWANRDLIERMVAEGHEVGSHSYWHPNMRTISDARIAFELNMFQRVFASVTGHGTFLFREPYQRTGGPLNLAQAEPLWQAQNMGYFYVSSDIAPADWTDLTAEQITADVMRELETDGGNVIALHDGGTDQNETVRAVPMIVAALRANGYEIVSLSSLMGLSRDDVMPVVELPHAALFNLSYFTVNSINDALKLIFFTAITIGVLRTLFMLVLAIRRKRHAIVHGRYQPPVTVAIPAYNEESSIVEAVDSVLALKYPNLSVIVVDDGSTDGTFDLLLKHYSRNRRVRIVAQFNHGKWSALNLAMHNAETEVVICIDADTRIDERAVLKLVSHFKDPFVGAVAGKVAIMNRKGLLTRMQALEYMVAQNIDRRAAESLNAMLVVPGAIGAWRVSAVKEAGLYSGDTLTEDADLTVTMNRLGYTICYEEEAVADTKVPETVKQLLAQRARWSLGMLQVAWKHRRVVGESRALGWFALPDLVLYGYLLAFLAPVADLLFLKFLFEYARSFWAEDVLYQGVPRVMLLTYLALPVMDLLVAGIAHAFDLRERAAIILLFPLQRFLYRPLLYYSAIRAVVRAVTGSLVKWSKAHRDGAAPAARSLARGS